MGFSICPRMFFRCLVFLNISLTKTCFTPLMRSKVEDTCYERVMGIWRCYLMSIHDSILNFHSAGACFLWTQFKFSTSCRFGKLCKGITCIYNLWKFKFVEPLWNELHWAVECFGPSPSTWRASEDIQIWSHCYQVSVKLPKQ